MFYTQDLTTTSEAFIASSLASKLVTNTTIAMTCQIVETWLEHSRKKLTI